MLCTLLRKLKKKKKIKKNVCYITATCAELPMKEIKERREKAGRKSGQTLGPRLIHVKQFSGLKHDLSFTESLTNKEIVANFAPHV